jgi:hypothetical protein
MYYTIYKTTNLVNRKIYIGAHKTSNPDDDYLGPNKLLKAAIIIYGKENFKKEILYICETEQEMFAKEREIVNEEFIAREDTYNTFVMPIVQIKYDQALSDNERPASEKNENDVLHEIGKGFCLPGDQSELEKKDAPKAKGKKTLTNGVANIMLPEKEIDEFLAQNPDYRFGRTKLVSNKTKK